MKIKKGMPAQAIKKEKEKKKGKEIKVGSSFLFLCRFLFLSSQPSFSFPHLSSSLQVHRWWKVFRRDDRWSTVFILCLAGKRKDDPAARRIKTCGPRAISSFFFLSLFCLSFLLSAAVSFCLSAAQRKEGQRERKLTQPAAISFFLCPAKTH